MANNFKYFISFYRQKIDNGEKQVDLALQVNKSPQYIHNLYKGEPKSCPFDVQEGIAAYYNMTYDEMIIEGKLIYQAEKRLGGFTEEEIYDEGITNPDKQASLLMQISKGIISNLEKIKDNEDKTKKIDELSREIGLLKEIFNNLDEGVTFFDAERNFVFSSNRWNFLDGVDLTVKPSIEKIVIHIRKKIENLDEVLDAVLSVANNPQKEIETDVKLYSGHVFNFRIVPVFKNKVSIGTLLVNTIKHKPLPEN